MSAFAHSHKEHWNDFFRDEFSKESERASVIVAAAMLEQALEALLKNALVPIPGDEDAIFDGPYAPLASFSAKIDIAFRIGLIPPSYAKSLHLVRRIRNSFAHDVTGCSVEDSAVRNRTLELVRLVGTVENDFEFRKGFAEGLRGDFQMTVSWMLWFIWSGAESVARIEPHKELVLSKSPTPKKRRFGWWKQ